MDAGDLQPPGVPGPGAASGSGSGSGSDPSVDEPNCPSSGDGELSGEALARAIASVLGGAIREFDAREEAASRSQDALALSVDRLTGELDKLLEDAPLPFIMQHAARISGIRKRVFALNSVLKSIQRRIDNIDMMLSAGSSHEKVASEVTGQPES